MFCLNGIYSIKYIKLVVDKLVFGAYNRQSVVNVIALCFDFYAPYIV